MQVTHRKLLLIFILIYIRSATILAFRHPAILAIQHFDKPGYPSFHIIKTDSYGGLFCGTSRCPNPPYMCRIESKSDQSKTYLNTTIECIGQFGRTLKRNIWQPSPDPRKTITILTEADVSGTVSNMKNDEQGDWEDVQDADLQWMDFDRMFESEMFGGFDNPHYNPFPPFNGRM